MTSLHSRHLKGYHCKLGACVIKLITAVIYGFHNKIEFLLVASLSNLVYCLWVRPGAFPKVE
jgi:hypothetical protein